MNKQKHFSSSIFPEIIHNYGYSTAKYIFRVELNLDLDFSNILEMHFLVSGDKTNADGIKITFIIDQIEVYFTVEKLFQDNSNHNLTQLFSFPEVFTGKKNITVTCEARTSYYHEVGTIHITSQTAIKKIQSQTLTDAPSSLPLFPDWIKFKGSSVNTITKSVSTIFNNSLNFDKLNLTLSFLASDFSALNQHLEIEINYQIVNSQEFQEDEHVSESFLSEINSGINLLTIHFSVEMCIDEILFSLIHLAANGINNQDILPNNAYEWYEWNNNEFDHTFDLSALKPQVSYPEQIVEIRVNYGCIGAVILPSIRYDIIAEFNRKSGEIGERNQINSSQTITTKFMTKDNDESITFRIQGSATGLGYFYILNTSFITFEALPELQEHETLERTVIDTVSHPASPFFSLDLTYTDFFRTTLDNYHHLFNISFSFSLTNVFGNAIRELHVLMKFDLITIFDEQFSYEENIDLQKQQTLYSNVYDVYISLTLYRDGDEITLTNLKYSLFSSSNITNNATPENTSSDPVAPSKFIMLIEYGGMLSFFIVMLAQHLLKRSKERTDTGEANQVEVRGGVIGRLIAFPKILWLKVKETTLRLYLLPVSIVFFLGKTAALYNIITELNTIANNRFLQPQLVGSGKWGFYSFFVCSSLADVVLLSTLFLIFTSTFYVDLYKLSKSLGKVTLLLYLISGTALVWYIIRNYSRIKIYALIILFISLLGIVIAISLFGKTKMKQPETTKSYLFKKNTSEATSEDETLDLPILKEESALSDEEYKEYRQKIVNYIIDKVKHPLQVPVNHFSEKFQIAIDLAHKLLIEIDNEISSLGEYDTELRIYIRSKDSEIENGYLDIRSQKKCGVYKDNTRIDTSIKMSEKIETNLLNSTGNYISSTKSLYPTPILDTKDGTISSIFNSNIIGILDVDFQTDIHTLIVKIRRYLLSNENQLQKANKVFFKIIKDDFIDALERITNLKKNDGVLKERITQYLLYLAASLENKDSISHPSFEHYSDFFSEKNLLCGFGAISSRGFDEITLNTVRTSEGYPRISKLIFNEFKYKYSNKPFQISSFRRDFRSLPSVMRQSIRDILDNSIIDSFASYKIESGKILVRKNTGFSFGITPNRGNDLLIKLDSWFSSLEKLRNARREILGEQAFKLDERLETQETLGEGIYNALRAQGELEALMENGFYLDFEGHLAGNHFSIHPKTSRKSKFVINNEISPEIEINTEHFSMSNGLNILKNRRIVQVNQQLIDVDAYSTFNLIEDKIFSLYFKDLNKDRYCIYVTDSIDGFRRDSTFIVVNYDFFDNHYQDLCYLIKTRLINDIRNKCLLVEWWRELDNKEIVPIFVNSTKEGFEISNHFTFISTKVNSNSKGYLFNSSLRRIGKYQYLIGWDTARHFAFLPENSRMKSSKWFGVIDLAFSIGTAKHDDNPFNESDDLFASWEWARKNARIKETIQLDNEQPSNFFAFQHNNKSIFNFLKKIFDYSFSSWFTSKSSRGNKILNILYPYWLSPRLFQRKPIREFRVIVFEKKDGRKTISQINSSSDYLNFTIKLHRSCINLFPQIHLTDNNTVRFGYTATNQWVIDLLFHELHTCPYTNNSGNELVMKQYEKWNEFLKSDKSPIKYMNPMQACWLLYKSILKMEQIELQLFNMYKQQYDRFRYNKQTLEAQKMWQWSKLPLTRRNFQKYFSFAIMPVENASMKPTLKTGNLRYRILYETSSEEIKKFVHTVFLRILDIYENQELHDWIKPVFKMIMSFFEII